MGTPVHSVKQFVEYRIFQHSDHAGFIVIPARNENVENFLDLQFAFHDYDHNCHCDIAYRFDRRT